MIGENPFTHESWERKINNEQEGENPEDSDLKTFEAIKEGSMKSPELREMMADVENAILRYGESVIKFDRSRIDVGEAAMSRKDLENADVHRRTIHDALIDKLNVMSREFVRAKLDNSWRSVVGSDRSQIGQWALRVAENLKNSILKEHHLE